MSKTNTLKASTPSSPEPSPAPPSQEPEMSKEAMSTLKKKRIAHPGFLRMSIKCVRGLPCDAVMRVPQIHKSALVARKAPQS